MCRFGVNVTRCRFLRLSSQCLSHLRSAEPQVCQSSDAPPPPAQGLAVNPHAYTSETVWYSCGTLWGGGSWEGQQREVEKTDREVKECVSSIAGLAQG